MIEALQHRVVDDERCRKKHIDGGADRNDVEEATAFKGSASACAMVTAAAAAGGGVAAAGALGGGGFARAAARAASASSCFCLTNSRAPSRKSR